ncbi:MAG TPA: cell division topological specificity factor MinE [Rhodanobacteraceae bacterium]|nr:cell division topological specificity factor MinE [Rhodanobacteraceae bacterium]
MGILDFLRTKPRNSAGLARERLRIIVAQERSQRGGPDYLPLLRSELLEVIRKYVNVDPEAVQIRVEHGDDNEVLELSVALPESSD